MKIIIAALISTLLFLSACNASDSKQDNHNIESIEMLEVPLTDIKWELFTLGEELVEESSERGKPHLTLDITENRAYGFGGCNSFNGSFSLGDNNALKFTQMASTKMFCAESMALEDAFMPIFEAIAHYEISGEQLHLKSAEGEVLAVFVMAE